ncbi:MAG: DNA double-strand break repair nuclease NurA [bacterium]|nr:DNA double-strand break repair nuclease NurA [bacterium]
MLDFGALKRQIDRMATDAKDLQNDFQQRIDLAIEEMKRWEEPWKDLTTKIARSRTSWLVAGATGPFTERCPVPERPKKLTVIAADGSQIFPDRHEIAQCFLINIGYVVLHYGTGERPVLSSEPSLYYQEEDLYQEWAGKRTPVTREMVGVRRNEMEMSKVVALSQQAKAEGRTVVGLTDGTLILWMLEGKPFDFRRTTLQATLNGLEQLREARVPIAGYISDPGSADVLNGLRVGLCPEQPPDCDRCPWKAAEMQQALDLEGGSKEPVTVPCEPIAGVTDDILFARTLKKGERSGVFQSSSKILEDYGPHRICFFYVHTGWEIGRVEIPLWVAEDRALLDLVHTTVCDQAEKGRGYPVVLSESHERAVVRGADRDIFFKFLRDSFVKNEVKAEISLKQLKKVAATV